MNNERQNAYHLKLQSFMTSRHDTAASEEFHMKRGKKMKINIKIP